MSFSARKANLIWRIASTCLHRTPASTPFAFVCCTRWISAVFRCKSAKGSSRSQTNGVWWRVSMFRVRYHSPDGTWCNLLNSKFTASRCHYHQTSFIHAAHWQLQPIGWLSQLRRLASLWPAQWHCSAEPWPIHLITFSALAVSQLFAKLYKHQLFW